jgi:ubiquinol-cytochrome c reductase cytochrome b subunit
MTRISRKDLLRFIIEHVTNYPSPINLNFNWGFGSLALFYLIIQILTGVLLTIYYIPSAEYAFESIQFIMREVNYGWLIRYGHTTGSSMFFAVVYLHIGRGLYYGSYYYPRILVWYSGLIIFLLMMATAFFGYILPWGQMSYWAATVITNLFATIPYIGEQFTQWLWGDYSVGAATLKRFFTFHFVLPFLILGFVLIHIILLHRVGSNNPIGRDHPYQLPLYPYFFVKDVTIIFFSLFIFVTLLSYYPNLFIHPDNNIVANPLVTPEHIVPEWYFLPFYAILRTIPSKFLGFVCMILSILVMFIIPYLGVNQIYRSTRYQYLQNYFFFLFVGNFLALGWLGGCTIEYPYLFLSRLCTVYYFLYLFVINPYLSLFISHIHNVTILNFVDLLETELEDLLMDNQEGNVFIEYFMNSEIYDALDVEEYPDIMLIADDLERFRPKIIDPYDYTVLDLNLGKKNLFSLICNNHIEGEVINPDFVELNNLDTVLTHVKCAIRTAPVYGDCNILPLLPK